MNKIPATLYRGVVIKYSQLEDFKFYDVDLVPHDTPIIDEQGRKLRTDGNEYGIYMSDNKSMVYMSYGDIHQNREPLSYKVQIGRQKEKICIPDIGVCYDIKTEGLDVREPQISSILMGHYNNGMQGREYIADTIPKENVTVSRIQIGEDYLHDGETIDSSDIKKADRVVRQTLKERITRLEELLKALEALSPLKRQSLGESDQKLLRDIFGKNGVKYLKEEEIGLADANDVLTRLLFTVYHNSPDNIDFQTLLYVEQLKERIAKMENSNNLDSILKLVQLDIDTNQKNKEAFLKRREQEGKIPNPIGFDSKEAMLKNVLTILIDLQKKKNERKEENQKKQQENILAKIESLLQFKISSSKGYLVDPNKFNGIPYINYKTSQELKQEQEETLQKIEELYTNGAIDLGTAKMMKQVIIEEYTKMQQTALEREQRYPQGTPQKAK